LLQLCAIEPAQHQDQEIVSHRFALGQSDVTSVAGYGTGLVASRLRGNPDRLGTKA
jgi:hypothetical protein